MNQIIGYFMGLAFCAIFFTGCTKFVENGPQSVSPTSMAWLSFKGGEKLTYRNTANQTMTIQNNELKKIYNSMEDCNSQGLNQVCDRYLMEQVFVSGVTGNQSLAVSYNINRRAKEGNFYDVLDILVTHNANPQINLPLVVFKENELINTEIPEISPIPSVTLGEKTFQNVYHIVKGERNIYFTKEKGVVAFNYDGNQLWVIQ